MIDMKLENNEIAVTAPILTKLTSAIEAYPEVLSGYLFGSTATGHAHKDSDVDIAVRLVSGLSAEKRFQLRLELIDRIEKLVELAVDIVLMNDTSLIMLNQIFSHGMPVFIRNTEDEEQFKLLKQKEFFDFRYYLDRDLDQMKRYFGATAHD
jgi:predicted nucleotidyltransferase